jgi:hypothetical protein
MTFQRIINLEEISDSQSPPENLTQSPAAAPYGVMSTSLQTKIVNDDFGDFRRVRLYDKLYGCPWERGTKHHRLKADTAVPTEPKCNGLRLSTEHKYNEYIVASFNDGGGVSNGNSSGKPPKLVRLGKETRRYSHEPKVNVYTECGRHGDDCAFGGFSVSRKLKSILGKKNDGQ